jgi:hypothetical protein
LALASNPQQNRRIYGLGHEEKPEMLNWFKGSSRLQCKAEELYGGVVAAARHPEFYGKGRVADTPQGRFEMVLLHLFVVTERLAKDGKDGKRLAQALIETFVTDMDDCMREMGVGDLAVPKRVKRAAAIFYKRAQSYRAGLQEALAEPADNAPLAAFVQRTILSEDVDKIFGDTLAAYIARLTKGLGQTRKDDILRANFSLATLATLS